MSSVISTDIAEPVATTIRLCLKYARTTATNPATIPEMRYEVEWKIAGIAITASTA